MLFLVMPSERTKNNRHKLKHERFPFDIKKHSFTVKLPRWVVESPFFRNAQKPLFEVRNGIR